MAKEKTDSNRFVFWQGSARLYADKFTQEVECRAVLANSTDKDLRIEVTHEFGFTAFELVDRDQIWIEIPGVVEHIGLLLQQASVNSRGNAVLTFGLKRSPLWITKSLELHTGRAMLINFGEYSVHTPTYPRFELKGSGWAACFIPISERTLAVSETMHSEDYRITHQVEFAREDGSLFTPSEAQSFLGDLSLYLSFCRGQWVAVSFTVAFDIDGHLGLEQWGTGRVSSWREPDSWLDSRQGNPIVELYSAFCSKLVDESWRDVLSHVVYWFTRAETNNVGPDGACILLQATLERFAWHLLVRERKAISEKGFRDLAASDQLRLMLNLLSVPIEVPAGLCKLVSLAKSKGQDGPEVFTFIRNRLVHPPKPSATREELPYYEAYCLAKWYVELAVLSVCGYRGDYNNRTLSTRWVGQVEKVPWA